MDFSTLFGGGALYIDNGMGGIHLPQRGGSQHKDLKMAGRFRGVPEIQPAVSIKFYS